jgi:hypothetical protein
MTTAPWSGRRRRRSGFAAQPSEPVSARQRAALYLDRWRGQVVPLSEVVAEFIDGCDDWTSFQRTLEEVLDPTEEGVRRLAPLRLARGGVAVLSFPGFVEALRGSLVGARQRGERYLGEHASVTRGAEVWGWSFSGPGTGPAGTQRARALAIYERADEEVAGLPGMRELSQRRRGLSDELLAQTDAALVPALERRLALVDAAHDALHDRLHREVRRRLIAFHRSLVVGL